MHFYHTELSAVPLESVLSRVQRVDCGALPRLLHPSRKDSGAPEGIQDSSGPRAREERVPVSYEARAVFEYPRRCGDVAAFASVVLSPLVSVIVCLFIYFVVS